MLLELKRALDRAGESGAPVSVVDLSSALGVPVGEVGRMLEILAWRGDVEVVESEGCAGVCARCPLKSVCASTGSVAKFYRLPLPEASGEKRSG